MNPDKLAVLFPGIGYTCDKPLLYYSAKLAASNGYRVVPVRYSGFPKKIVGDAGRMKESLDIACSQAESLLKEVKWESFEKIVFLLKNTLQRFNITQMIIICEFNNQNTLVTVRLSHFVIGLFTRIPTQLFVPSSKA